MNKLISDRIVQQIIKNSQMSLKETDITSNGDLIDDLGLDSFSMVQLVVSLENEFNIEFELDELDFENFRKYKVLEERILNKIEI
ncbi:hypothetical protein KF134_1239 [Lactococcus lactis subsp. lactis]|uniref:acyl carrier protein n=1 Tax=Lactococcus lactis TaxID=1358 RepID=UPI00071D9DA1|nr:phosphopantetheine-binding protein [Lactococcus lactis]KST91465.1 hypothetical protein KF134_1239 [Lactococcus lactis subsp. lactis]